MVRVRGPRRVLDLELGETLGQGVAVLHLAFPDHQRLPALRLQSLKAGGVTFHFSEVKGPVMDQLSATGFLEVLSGEVFLSQNDAQTTLRVGSGL